jgi:hypothetical protein
VTPSQLLEEAVQIAWDYLKGTGEIEDCEAECWFLSNTIEKMIREGVSNKLVLANKAIREYQKLKSSRILQLVR